TVVGCMDGRVQDVISEFGQKTLNSRFPDTITEPGIVGMLTQMQSADFLESLKQKLLISLDKHHANGIIVDGHQECAGDPVDDKVQREHIKKAVEVIRGIVGNRVPV